MKTKELLEKIASLEKRVAELESKQPQVIVVPSAPAPTVAPYVPYQPYVHWTIPHWQHDVIYCQANITGEVPRSGYSQVIGTS